MYFLEGLGVKYSTHPGAAPIARAGAASLCTSAGEHPSQARVSLPPPGASAPALCPMPPTPPSLPPSSLHCLPHAIFSLNEESTRSMKSPTAQHSVFWPRAMNTCIKVRLANHQDYILPSSHRRVSHRCWVQCGWNPTPAFSVCKKIQGKNNRWNSLLSAEKEGVGIFLENTMFCHQKTVSRL